MAPFLGPALVLYLVADVIAARDGADGIGFFVAALALALSLVFARRVRAGDPPGIHRVRWLALAAGALLVRAVAPDVVRPEIALVDVGAGALFGALVVDLALGVPDALLPSARARLSRVVLAFGALTVACVGAAAWAPSFFPSFARSRVPAALVDLPLVAAVAGIGLAFAARLARLRRGGAPEALAANAWPLLGLGLALVAALVWPLAALTSVVNASPVARVAPALGLGLVVWSHLRLLDPEALARVGSTSRRVLAGALALAVVLGLVALLALRLVPSLAVPPLLLWAFGILVAGALAYRGFVRLLERVLAPARGQLLRACAEVVDSTPGVRTLDDLAGVLLRALRRATDDPSAEPVLYLLHPDVEARIDAAGIARLGPGAMPTVILRHLRAAPGEIVLRGPLEDRIVRSPALRPLIDAVVSLDALCVVPLGVDGELEGGFVVPRGGRTSVPTLEEISALETLARWVGGFVAVLVGQARARERASIAESESMRTSKQVVSLERELERGRAEERLLRSGRAHATGAPAPVAYSASMRALVERLRALAPGEAPLLLTAESGTELEALARLVHEASSVADGPLLVCDCVGVREHEAASALFGTEEPKRSGWLDAAAGGTLVLLDLPALPREVQRALARALAEGRVPTADGDEERPLVARVVASARAPLATLVAIGGIDPELADRFAPRALRIPALAERAEDLPSLVLLALDRAARRVGREPVGIEPDANAYLLAYDWPGNFAELESIVTQAVTRTQGPRVRLDDLPTLAGVARPGDPDQGLLEGSFEAVERRVVERALARAGGNKSEAARVLGLKRSTFVDKLRRHGLDDGPRRPSRTPAPN